MSYLKKLLAFFSVLSCLLIIETGFITVSGADATNITYTLSAGDEWVITQDAYLVSDILLKNAEIWQPEDIFVSGDELYVADTGNSRILRYNIKTGAVSEFGQDVLASPSGIFVTESGETYVADNMNEAVYVFSASDELLKVYERPVQATFGTETQYIPSKVSVNDSGIIYIVSEGSYDGMIQLDRDGTFLGYYGYNNNPMSFAEYLQDIFFTEEQKSKLFNRIPYSFTNLARDEKGMIYTVTQSVEGNAVKKHDISGKNILPTRMQDEKNFVDVAIGNMGQIYALTQTGLLFEYDTDGNLLFSLGGIAISYERSGLFTTAAALDTDRYGNVYVLDSERGLVHVFSQTVFAQSVHTAMNLYNNGYYEESILLWQDIMRRSGNSRIAENGIANCSFQLQDYDTAAEYYRLAENRDGYSDAYWQIRNRKISDMMSYIAGFTAVVLAVLSILKRRRANRPDGRRYDSKLLNDIKLVSRVLKHPIDSFYSIRREGAGSVLSASIIYLAGLTVFICNYLLRGFTASVYNTDNTSIIYVALLFTVPVFLFVGSNFFVGEINESEGRLRDVFIGTAYVMSPFIVLMPFIIVATHFMTKSESAIISIISLIVYFWVFALLLIYIKEIHAYGCGGVIKNLLITFFLMAVIILAFSLLFMFWDQLVNFVLSIVSEVKYRVS